jgi:hypothetical protein
VEETSIPIVVPIIVPKTTTKAIVHNSVLMRVSL